MNNTLSGAELVARWRNGGERNNPAGPLFASGEFAEADIVNADAAPTACSGCSGSYYMACC
ncbi:MAG TPA: DUF6229 family protein [Candidatus Angelobacter sp.]|jgi:hypothetical protein